MFLNLAVFRTDRRELLQLKSSKRADMIFSRSQKDYDASRTHGRVFITVRAVTDLFLGDGSCVHGGAVYAVDSIYAPSESPSQRIVVMFPGTWNPSRKQ